MLDVDGGLLDRADYSLSPIVAPSMLDLLRRLHSGLDGALALLSVQDLNHIDGMSGGARWAAAGLDGLELRHADGSFRRKGPSDASQTRLRELVTALFGAFEGVTIEDKQRTMVLHCHSDPALRARVRVEALGLMPQLPEYELKAGRECLAFRPSGMDKGQAVRELLRHPAFAQRKLLYLGCDISDETAFKRVNRVRGYSIRIGQREPTQARYTLPDPASARAWLGRALVGLSPATR